MQSQITCPSCNTPFTADIHQVVDVGLEPELKEMLMRGYLNIAQCPACNSVTQVATPLLYHDPENEQFMVYMPMELNLSHTEQQEQIGQLVKQAMDRLPAEQRRGYMLQPKTLISFQSLLEKVLETEGITPEMLAKQRRQAELLQELLRADKQTAEEIIRSREEDIDENFFAMMQAVMDSANQSTDEVDTLKLVNLQAKLYKLTPIGQQMERRQKALHAFTREAKKDGLSHQLLLKHVLMNREDIDVVKSLVLTGQQVFDYQFFLLFSEKIEKRQKAGVESEQLVSLRDELLEFQNTMEKQSREALGKATRTLSELISADDKEAAIHERLNQIDDLFMAVLSANLAQAKENEDRNRIESLQEVQEAIFNEVERHSPPEIRLLNKLVRAETNDQRQQILNENQTLVGEELLELVGRIKSEATEQDNNDLVQRLTEVQSSIASKLLA